MSNKRHTKETYYDFLNAYFEKQYAEPLVNAIDQAVMTHILDLCNKARGDTIKTTITSIGVKSAQNRRRVGESIQRLVEKNYIVVRECAEKMIEIRLKIGANPAVDEPNLQAESAFSDLQEKEKDKTRQERKANSYNFKKQNGHYNDLYYRDLESEM